MTVTPSRQASVDPFFSAWCKVVAVLSVVVLVGGQLVAGKPDMGLFLVSIPFFAIPVAFLSAVAVWTWDTVKVVFE